MPAAQQRNDELAQLLTADLLSVDDRNCCFSAYDANGVVFVTVQTMELDTLRLNTAPTLFDWQGDSILTITEPGVYQFSFDVNVFNSDGDGANEAWVWLEEDPATGTYAAVAGFTTIVYVPAGGGRQNAGGRTGILHVGENYKYRLRMMRNQGTDLMGIASGGSLFNVVRLFGLR